MGKEEGEGRKGKEGEMVRLMDYQKRGVTDDWKNKGRRGLTMCRIKFSCNEKTLVEVKDFYLTHGVWERLLGKSILRTVQR